jgi:hypothetical protein
MMRPTALLALCAVLGSLVAVPRRADADPDPKRKVVVLEYRANSPALPGIAVRLQTAMSRETSLQVLGPDQTRALYGEHLDQVIVKCGGEAQCVARIGQKVGAAEVILVGISELGDVILTLQRIDVVDRGVASRIADSIAVGKVPSDDQVDGYLARLLPPGDFLRFGVIDIVANLAGAAVTVSGKPQGVTPIKSLKLHAPSTYEIRVEKSGYVPFATKVALPPDSEIKVEAQLSKRGAVAWYQHWYVLAAAGVIVAGAGGTAIYFGTRDTAGTGDGRLTFTATVK